MAFERNPSSVFRAMPRKCGGKEGGEGGRHHQQVLCHTMREVAVSEYYSEGPKPAIWLMDFEHPQLSANSTRGNVRIRR
jgi:hypothetical protein